MKKITFLLIVSMLFTHTAWAGRSKLSSIAEDPYISALVLDADTGKVLFADHADAVVYPASVLKLMNLLVILDQIKKGTVKLDDMVQVTREAAKTGGSQVYLDPREQFSVDDLLYALMVQSANDAAVALATHLAGSKEGFVAMMNRKAQELGMKHTHFYSVHGLPPAAGQKPDETTASDLGILCRELARMPEVFKYTGTEVRGFRDGKFIMRNHNHLLGAVEGCDGFKTGYFRDAGFSIAATAKRGGVRIIAIVMGSKNRKVRDAKAAELLAKGFVMEPPREQAATAATAANVPEPVHEQVTVPPPAAPTETPHVAVSQQTRMETGVSFFAGWWKFFLGLGLGLLLLVLWVVFGSRKRGREKAGYVRHP